MEADDLQSDQAQVNHQGERLIADRLDALEAEKVIQRALELEAESLDEPHIVTTDQLERIAAEIGVDPAFVHQALGELKLAPVERGRFEQWLLPDDLVETTTLSGFTREQVDDTIARYMTQNEGLIAAGKIADGMAWNIDQRWTAKAISGTLSGGNRMYKVAGSDIAHRVHSVSEHEHTVAFQSKGRGPLLVAKLLIGLGLGVGVLAGLAASGLVNGLVLFAVFAGAGIAGGVGGARWWARGIRGAFRRSLMGLANRAQHGTKGWFKRRRRQRKTK